VRATDLESSRGVARVVSIEGGTPRRCGLTVCSLTREQKGWIYPGSGVFGFVWALSVLDRCSGT